MSVCVCASVLKYLLTHQDMRKFFGPFRKVRITQPMSFDPRLPDTLSPILAACVCVRVCVCSVVVTNSCSVANCCQQGN